MRKKLRRMITAIGRWGFTIIIVPKRGEVRRVAIPWLGVIGLAMVLGLIIYAPIAQLRIMRKESFVRELLLSNQRLKEENSQIKPALDRSRQAAEALNRLKRENEEIKAILRSVQSKSTTHLSSRGGFVRPAAYKLPAPVVSELDQKVSLLDTLDSDTASLLRETNRQLAEVTQLKQDLLAYERRLDHTPDNWPVRGRLTSRFGYRRDPFTGRSSYHNGIDLTVPLGTSVRAAADGVVYLSGWYSGYGRAVIIDHGYAYRTLYGHNSELLVSSGQRVKKGQIIARSGSSGRSTGPHVHFEVWYNGRRINPLNYLR